MAGIASTTTGWAEGIAAELASGLPLAAERTDMRYQWIARFLANDRVHCDAVMQPFAIEILANLARDGRKITLIMDQTKASDRHQILMLSVGFGERALPLAWRVEETDGAIGFATQKALLEAVVGWLRQDVVVTRMADRFYGTPSLIGWLADHRWGYRLRLKGNLTVRLGAAKTTTGDLALSGDTYFADVRFTAKRVRTHIGILKDPGHSEPWIIAMSDKPNYLNTLDYSKRWGIEPMFSDFKSRGFGLAQTQIQYPGRLARLILVMALAIYWAVSAGIADAAENPVPAEKNSPDTSPQSCSAQGSPGSHEACATCADS
ncbi:transposase [Mesorhizobium sp.]|uniref:transposase n=1 Tax=Mesorhizobium sp. TaxID=1871066 RepID=UPI000FEA1698|nr:transposase [Mesorhizobium sp.]RWQ61615.1 MAG: hypothetical protein EOS83_00685 [Mesorhizobium sp.]